MKSFFKITLLCALLISPALSALSNVLLSGDVMLRLMDDQISLKKKKGEDDSTRTNEFYLNYAWNFKALLTASEFLQFGFRLSNPSGSCGEKVSSNMTWVNKGGYRLLSVPEAYFKWTVKKFSLSGGIIPVFPNTLMNFVLYEGVNYAEVGRSPWNVLMNNSQQGFMLELIALDKMPNAFINVQLLVATATDLGADTNKSATDNIFKNDQWRFVLQAPMDFLGKKIMVNPGFNLRTNAGRSKDGDKGAASFSGGLTLGYKLLPDLMLRGGYALGGFDKRDLGLADSIAPFGMLAEYGLTFNTPIGPLMLDGNFSNWQDRSKKDAITKEVVLNKQVYGEFKFGFVIKSFTIMPRFRIWYNSNDTNDFTKLHLRPELQFKAAFK